MIKIGITEAGDPGLDLSWTNKIKDVDGVVFVSKKITTPLIEYALSHKDTTIVHATVTGYGGTVLEPYAPHIDYQLDMCNYLVNNDFYKSHIIIRVDPIIPTQKGIDIARKVIEKFAKVGYNRFRISIIDMYNHVKERFKDFGLPLPYGESFGPDRVQVRNVDRMIKYLKDIFSDITIECCAEPELKEAIHSGCISKLDLSLMGLSDKNATYDGFQRRNCMCYAGKTELLSKKKRCSNGCLYCYWKD